MLDILTYFANNVVATNAHCFDDSDH